MKKTLKVLALVLALVLMFALVACDQKKDEAKDEKKDETQQQAADETKDEEKKDEAMEGEKKDEPAAPGSADAAGFTEYPIGEEDGVDAGPIHVAGVYFQPVDMEPAGNSLSKAEADCHIEADISATEEGAALGYGLGDFVPWLQVKCELRKEGSDKVQEVAFMPMNASDGPHYGANIKFEEGVGKYNVKFIISAPGNEYLLHVDKETGVTGRFWTEPIVVEFKDFEWEGAAGRW